MNSVTNQAIRGLLAGAAGTIAMAGTAFTRRFSGLWTRRVAGLLMIVFAVWTAFGTYAPHGGGHGARHGDTTPSQTMPAQQPAPAEPHHH